MSNSSVNWEGEAMKSDIDLKNDVLKELSREQGIGEAHIGVIVKEGVVTVIGNVDTYAEKRAAECAVKRVSGVRAVADEIEVKSCLSVWRDAEIAALAASALERNASVPRDCITVIVENRLLTLEGNVERPSQKDAAEDAVKHLTGLKGVINEIMSRDET